MWLTRTLVITALVCALLSLAPSVSSQEAELEYPSFDGFYHNIAAPDWGAAERHMIRISPAAYEDGGKSSHDMLSTNLIFVFDFRIIESPVFRC